MPIPTETMFERDCDTRSVYFDPIIDFHQLFWPAEMFNLIYLYPKYIIHNGLNRIFLDFLTFLFKRILKNVFQIF